MVNYNMKKLNKVIEHYKRLINKATVSNDKIKLVKCLYKLSDLPITRLNLKTTGIGRVVKNLIKYKGEVGEEAKILIIYWKCKVKIEEIEYFCNSFP